MVKREKLKRSDFSFWTALRTRWGDMDGLRHINHAAYLSYMETARLDFYHNLGMDYSRWEAENSSILAGMEIHYFYPITHPSQLEIGQNISRIGRTSFDMQTGIFLPDEMVPILQAEFKLVAYNYTLNRPIPVPQVLHQYFQEHHAR
ncbi:MAG: acyl-CoA thioesterase [Fidelibacterota bacterium]